MNGCKTLSEKAAQDEGTQDGQQNTAWPCAKQRMPPTDHVTLQSQLTEAARFTSGCVHARFCRIRHNGHYYRAHMRVYIIVLNPKPNTLIKNVPSIWVAADEFHCVCHTQGQTCRRVKVTILPHLLRHPCSCLRRGLRICWRAARASRDMPAIFTWAVLHTVLSLKFGKY
eukprot:94986-Chlamydomonas_euryale.AAC.1